MDDMRYLRILILFLLVSTFAHAQKPNILWVTIEDTSPQLFLKGWFFSVETLLMGKLYK